MAMIWMVEMMRISGTRISQANSASVKVVRLYDDTCSWSSSLEDDWDELLAAGDRVGEDELAAREAALQFDDPVNIQYTSGTTGAPIGATLSHHNLLNNAYFGGEQLRLTEPDRLCASVPLYHTFGCVLAVLGCSTHGSCLVLPSETFDPRVRPGGCASRAVHGPLRSANHVHSGTGAATLRRLRALQPAHRHDGRRALPGRGHAPGPGTHAPARGDHHLRYDRDGTAVDPDQRRRRT
jgi:hypothetical protein